MAKQHWPGNNAGLKQNNVLLEGSSEAVLPPGRSNRKLDERRAGSG
jgi:hypothetical protein